VKKDRFPILFGVLAVVVIGGGVRAALTRDRTQRSGAGSLVVDNSPPTKRAADVEGAITVEAPLPEGPIARTVTDVEFLEERVDTIGFRRDGTTGATLAVATTGLAQLGVPEVVIRDVPSTMEWDAQNLLHAIGSAMVFGRPIGAGSTLPVELSDESGAPRTVTVSLSRDGERIAVVFPGPRARVSERIAEVLGAKASTPGSATFEMTDEIRGAMAKAHDEVRALASRWKDHPPANETLTVEAPFEDSQEGSEYLDVEVETIRGDELTGVLTMSPSLDIRGDYKLGSRVVVKLPNVLDYEWIDAQGREHGGEVGALIDKQKRD
jgi:hypothetical protein